MSTAQIALSPEVERKASGSSFYTAMKILPKAERDGMFAVYAFCRAVDDIADNQDGPREPRFTELEAWRHDIEALYAGETRPRVAFLEATVRHYGLHKEDFLAVIDGMEMDVKEDIRAPDMAKLELYCDRVACAVGRLSIKIFGMDEEPGFRLSHHLGRALQLTNILRDLDEDTAIGRLYLPRELLQRQGIVGGDPNIINTNFRIDAVCRALAAIAHTHYAEADRIMRAKPKGGLRAPRLMSAVYCRILTRMERDGWLPPRKRVKLPKALLLWLALRYGLAA